MEPPVGALRAASYHPRTAPKKVSSRCTIEYWVSSRFALPTPRRRLNGRLLPSLTRSNPSTPPAILPASYLRRVVTRRPVRHESLRWAGSRVRKALSGEDIIEPWRRHDAARRTPARRHPHPRPVLQRRSIKLDTHAMAAFKHSAVNFGAPDMPRQAGGRAQVQYHCTTL
jgi:hypothetical protein